MKIHFWALAGLFASFTAQAKDPIVFIHGILVPGFAYRTPFPS